MRILCFGELLFDHIEKTYYLGGAPVNFAGHSARLGAQAYLLSARGADPLGERAERELKENSILTDYISCGNEPTGVVEVTLTDGIPSYDIAFAAWDHISLDTHQSESLLSQQYDLLYIGSLAQRSRENRLFLSKLFEQATYRHVFFDVNLRQEFYSREVILSSLARTTIIKLNDEELPVISRMLFERELGQQQFFIALKELFPQVEIMLLTCGKEGAWFTDGTTSGMQSPGQVQVADTVGAGDSFSAGFVSALLRGKGLEESVSFASMLADYVVSHKGALPEYDSDLTERIRSALG